MSFWSKLFGKKKKKEEPVVAEKPAVEVAVEEAVEEAPMMEEEVVSEEPNVEEPEVVEPVVEEPEEEKEEEVVEAPIQEAPKEDVKVEKLVYEVKAHPDSGWQVIKQGNEKATKRTRTQSEAIEYCKENDYEYIVYKKDGTLR
jgi:hypothetical protein